MILNNFKVLGLSNWKVWVAVTWNGICHRRSSFLGWGSVPLKGQILDGLNFFQTALVYYYCHIVTSCIWSVWFDEFDMCHLWNFYHSQGNEHIHPSPKFPVLLCNFASSSHLIPFLPIPRWLLMSFCHYILLHLFWNHTVCCPFFAWLCSLSIITLRFSHVLAHVNSSFLLLLSGISLCGWLFHSLSTRWKDIGVYSFGVL